MRKLTTMLFVTALFLVLTSVFTSAVQFNIKEAREAEWERYEQYKEDYVDFYGLEGYEKYLSERNLQREFGFYSPSHYYIAPEVLAAKYNPPLQGEEYCTDTRGCTTSLANPSAVKYYGEKMNGHYVGAIASTVNGVYFDHPYANTNARANSYAAYNYGGAYGYGQTGLPDNAGAYARVATPAGEGYYIVGYY